MWGGLRHAMPFMCVCTDLFHFNPFTQTIAHRQMNIKTEIVMIHVPPTIPSNHYPN